MNLQFHPTRMQQRVPKFSGGNTAGPLALQDLLIASQELSSAQGAKQQADARFNTAQDHFRRVLGTQDLTRHETRLHVGDVIVALKHQLGTGDVINQIQTAIDERRQPTH